MFLFEHVENLLSRNEFHVKFPLCRSQFSSMFRCLDQFFCIVSMKPMLILVFFVHVVPTVCFLSTKNPALDLFSNKAGFVPVQVSANNNNTLHPVKWVRRSTTCTPGDDAHALTRVWTRPLREQFLNEHARPRQRTKRSAESNPTIPGWFVTTTYTLVSSHVSGEWSVVLLLLELSKI